MRSYNYSIINGLDFVYTQDSIINDIKIRNDRLHIALSKVNILNDFPNNPHSTNMQTDESVIVLDGFRVMKLYRLNTSGRVKTEILEDTSKDDLFNSLLKNISLGNSRVVELRFVKGSEMHLILRIMSFSDELIEVIIKHDESVVKWSEYVNVAWEKGITQKRKYFTIALYIVIIVMAVSLSLLSMLIINKYFVKLDGWSFELFFFFFLGVFSLIEAMIMKRVNLKPKK